MPAERPVARYVASAAELGARSLAALSPPRCVCCRRLARHDRAAAVHAPVVICAACERALPRARAGRPPGIGLDWVGVPLSWEGRGRDLVAALKFRRLTGVAGLAADLIAAELPPLPDRCCLVPVPAAPRRRRARGFDPAELIAASLAERLELPALRLLRRTDGGRQRGRGRAERLSRRPCFEPIAGVDMVAILVDDVVTTGATLAASATALEAGGVRAIGAVALAQTPPPGTVRLK